MAGAGPAGLAIGPLARGDEDEAAGLLARAFADQPLDHAVVGGSLARRLRLGLAGMRATLVAARGRADVRTARRDERLEGALLALPPYVFPLPPPPPWVQLRTLLRQGLAVAHRWREVFDALAAHHPPEPCAYLSLLAVEPACQGRGVGSALLSAWLADVDAEGWPAWLETAQPGNLPLYERFGFAVAGEVAVRGVPVWLMARAARTAL